MARDKEEPVTETALAETALTAAVESVMALPEGCGVTDGLMVVRNGEVIVERYGPEKDPQSRLLSWSVAKSVTHALCGIAVRDGVLDLDAPAAVPAWRGDERRHITVRQLLTMTSGLSFREDYVDGEASDVIEMLFGAGKEDVATFAADFPLVAEPGARNSYSSGTTNIVCGILHRLLDKRGDDFAAWAQASLWEPIGASDVELRFDSSGTFIGSSFAYMPLRDWARFGELYLAGGIAPDGTVVLPAGWVDNARTETATPPDPASDWPAELRTPYGSHWWRWPQGAGSIAALGYEGQHIVVLPAINAVVCRFGRTPDANKLEVRRRLVHLIDAL
jgi:CubicO group peptidase (beta-lactamase class C family)